MYTKPSLTRTPLKTIQENHQEDNLDKSDENSEGQVKTKGKAEKQVKTYEKKKNKASSDKFEYPEQDLENARKAMPHSFSPNVNESSSGRSKKRNVTSFEEHQYFQGPQPSSVSTTSVTKESSSSRSKAPSEISGDERRDFQKPESASKIARPVKKESSSGRSQKLYESNADERRDFQEPKSLARSSNSVVAPPQKRAELGMLMDIFFKSSSPGARIIDYALIRYFPEEMLADFKKLLNDFSFSMMGGNEIAYVQKIVVDASKNPESKALLALIEKCEEINPNLHPLAKGPTLDAVRTLVNQIKPLLKLVAHRMDGCKAFLELKLKLDSARDIPHKTIIEKFLDEPGNKEKVGPLYDFMYDFLNASFPLPAGGLHASVSEIMKISTEWASS